MKKSFSLVKWKKLQETMKDIAQIGTQEVRRSIQDTLSHIDKMKLLQKRKELFAELGRIIVELKEDHSLPATSSDLFKDPEISEILQEIKEIDKEIISKKCGWENVG